MQDRRGSGQSLEAARGHTTPPLSRNSKFPISPYHIPNPADPTSIRLAYCIWKEVDISNPRCGKLETELPGLKKARINVAPLGSVRGSLLTVVSAKPSS
jgi:hypothetical protein